MKTYFKKLVDGLSGFRLLGLAIILFLIPNLTIFFAIQIHPSWIRMLWLSADNPWGIFTAAFVHQETNHLVGNIIGFMFSILFFVFSNLSQDKERKALYSKIFLLMVFISGFLSNALKFFIWWNPSGITESGSYGASGVVYSAIGICTASAIVNITTSLKKYIEFHKGRCKKNVGKGDLSAIFINLLILIPIIIMIFFDPELFLNVGPGIDVFVHYLGFSIGLISTLILISSHHK